MATLPVPVLTNIFSFLSFFERKNIVQLVCKRWQDASKDPLLWKDSHCLITMDICREDSRSLARPKLEREDVKLLSVDVLQKGIRRIQFHKLCSRDLILDVCTLTGDGITNLSLKGCLYLHYKDYLELLLSCPNLQCLDLSNSMEVGKFIDNGLWKDTDNWHVSMKNLEHIDLGHTNLELTTSYASFLACLGAISPCLTSLGIAGLKTDPYIEERLFNILQSFQNLEKLDFRFTNLSTLFLKRVTDLLNVKVIKFSDDDSWKKGTENYRWISKVHYLQNLCIHDVEKLTSWDILKLLCHGQSMLRALGIHKCPELSSKRYTFEQKVSLFRNSISMENPHRSYFNPLWTVKELNLSSCSLIDEDISIFCEHLHSVEHLNISGSLITDKSVQKILICLTNLRMLDISQCFKLTDVAFLSECLDANVSVSTNTENAQISNLKKLEWLSFSNCSRFTDAALVPVCELENLRYLSLQGCIRISNDGVMNLVQRVNLLHCLNISYLSLDDNCIKSVAQNLSFMTTFNISQMPLITANAFVFISKNCKHLRYLDVSFCENITEDQCAKFEQEYGKQLVEFKS